MDNDLSRIVEQIGRENDKAEASRWAVCKMLADAYEELGAYERGLTAGLCVRLRKSSDQVYNLRNAETLRSLLNVSETLSPSHFWTLYRLRERYGITDDDCREWLKLAEENNLSVRDLAQEVEAAHVKSQRVAFLRHSGRLSRLVTRMYADSEGAGLPEGVRPLLKDVCDTVERFTAELSKWEAS